MGVSGLLCMGYVVVFWCVMVPSGLVCGAVFVLHCVVCACAYLCVCFRACSSVRVRVCAVCLFNYL